MSKITIDPHTVTLSSQNKVLFPEDGMTKGDPWAGIDEHAVSIH